MENWVSAWVDNKLTGFSLWYTRWHVRHCPRCTDSLPVLNALRARLRRLSDMPPLDEDIAPALTPERRVAVQAAWEQTDNRT
jgi:hypothetical protein